MSIRFKFRSSVNFDTIEIDGGKRFMTVGDLRSKILCQMKLNSVCHKDFDLVFFDALTGQEYDDYEFKIPSGSSVIVKRVPAEPVPSALLRHQKLEASELSEDIPKGMDCKKPKEIVPEKKLAPELGEHRKLEKVADTKGIDLQKVDLPSELRCPICNTYFKEAVMIPCCQHSFCKKCICEVLQQTGRCPKCSSTKYRVEHLLPNLSLRRAIEHFLESQILATTPENDMQKYVPDGESGIQGKEVSTICKRKLDFLNCTSATEKGSNQNMSESAYEPLNRKNSVLEGTGFRIGKQSANDFQSSTPFLNVNNRNRGRDTHEDLAHFVVSQGENQPLMPQVFVPDEADCTSQKRGPWVNSGGGDPGFAGGIRNKKAERTCYMCGSPGHFVRDCPFARTQRMFQTGEAMFQGGYPMPYWNPAAFSPYMNMYGNPGMTPFNATMFPPYGFPPYAPPPTYVPSGITRMGTRAEPPSRHSEDMGIQNSDNRTKYSHEKRKRALDYEDEWHEPRSSEHRSHRDRGNALSNSEESHGRKHKKIQSAHKRDEKRSHGSYHTDRSISGVEDVHSRYDHDKHHHHRSSTSDGSHSKRKKVHI